MELFHLWKGVELFDTMKRNGIISSMEGGGIISYYGGVVLFCTMEGEELFQLRMACIFVNGSHF